MRTQIRQSRDRRFVLTVSGPEYPHTQRMAVDRIEYAQALRDLYRRKAPQIAIHALLQAIYWQN